MYTTAMTTMTAPTIIASEFRVHRSNSFDISRCFIHREWLMSRGVNRTRQSDPARHQHDAARRARSRETEGPSASAGALPPYCFVWQSVDASRPAFPTQSRWRRRVRSVGSANRHRRLEIQPAHNRST